MTGIAISYARCSTDKQDLTMQREALLKFGVVEERIYTDFSRPSDDGTTPNDAAAR